MEIAKSGKWTINLFSEEKRIFIKKIENGKEKTIPVRKLTVKLICKNVFGTVVEFSAYRHKANGYKTRFTDSRVKTLKARGPHSKPLTPDELLNILTPWIGNVAEMVVNRAISEVGGNDLVLETTLQAA